MDEVVSWHSLEEQRSTLLVTALEARGMQPRKGGLLALFIMQNSRCRSACIVLLQ